jgi:hypothetical protein
MTPCEELGYKVGDRFKVNAECFGVRYSIGDVLVLTFDDGSDYPFFKNETTGRLNVCCSIQKLEIIKEWTGEGLPPVGTVCEYVSSVGRVSKGAIVCHIKTDSGGKVAIIQYPAGGWDYTNEESKFRPIKPKKTEAELMEEIFNKSGIQGLIDAGYHK